MRRERPARKSAALDAAEAGQARTRGREPVRREPGRNDRRVTRSVSASQRGGWPKPGRAAWHRPGRSEQRAARSASASRPPCPKPRKPGHKPTPRGHRPPEGRDAERSDALHACDTAATARLFSGLTLGISRGAKRRRLHAVVSEHPHRHLGSGTPPDSLRSQSRRLLRPR